MKNKIKIIIDKIDFFLFKLFGYEKKLYYLENLNEAKIIFSHLNSVDKNKEVRFVGGCVRKAIKNEKIDDIDLATNLVPNEVKKKLTSNGIQVIDTGILHGTVTAILNKKKFEITTLRKDVSTDGRHADVEFTLDWEQDARRRDFTINAIYADIDGNIFDPENGINDLKNGKVNFIGPAKDRIQEDYLRILRYFRFFTQYSKSTHDEDTIKFIKQNINGINKISNERIFDELKKILSLENIYELFNNNISKEIILNIFQQFKYYERLKNIITLNQKLKDNFDKELLLALLILDSSNNHQYFCHKYKVSNNLKNRFNNISKNYELIKTKKFYLEKNIKKMMYLLGKDYVSDLLLFAIGVGTKDQIIEIEKLLNLIKKYEIPKFPISGDYLKEHGYVTGEKLGNKLKFLEDRWVENNFVIDPNFIDNFLKKKNYN